jgi:hypothetical protein
VNEFSQHIGVGIGCIIRQRRIVGNQYFVWTVLFKLISEAFNARAQYDGSQIGSQSVGQAPAFAYTFRSSASLCSVIAKTPCAILILL